MKNIMIYSKSDCPFCVRAKEVLSERGLQYKELILNVDYNRDELRKLVPETIEKLTVPQIWFGEHYIGGCDDLFEYLEQTSGGFGDDLN